MARSTLCWAQALVLFAVASSAFPQDTGSITGHVRRATTGAPLPEIQVQITSADGGYGGTATSGLDGLFVVSGLAPGYYLARTSNGLGFVDELYYEMPCPSWCTTSAGTPVLVEAGAVTGHVDFTLQASARLAGTITDAASGVPLAGIGVMVLTTTGNQVASAQTAPDGTYSLWVPFEGRVLVRADGSGRGYVNELFDNVACLPECDLSRATAVMLAFDTVRAGVDFALVAGGSITGRVVDEATTLPIAGGVVRVLDAGGGTRAQASTDADGRYAAYGLAAGTYRVRADATDFLAEAYDNVPCPRLDCAATTGAAVPVTLATATAGIDFALTRGGQVEGLVTDAVTTAPLASVNVEVLSASGNWVASAASDGSGRYAVGGLAAGTYFVRTRSSGGYMDELYNDVPCPGGSCAASGGTSVTVAAPGATVGVDFALTPGGQITGVVIAQDTGQPLGSADVALYDARGDYLRNAFTDPAGTYAFGGLSAGTYFVRAGNVADDYIGELFDDLPCPGQQCAATSGTPVSVTLAGTTGGVDFVLARGGRIAGTVTDASSGAPVTDASVEVRTATSQVGSTQTDASGHYLVTGLEVGTYYILARTSSNSHLGEVYDDVACIEWPCPLASATTVAVALGATIGEIDFALQPAGAISGRVVDSVSGAPVAGISLSAVDSMGNSRRTTTASPSGDYTLSGLLPGTYTVRVNDTGDSGYLAQMYANVPCPWGSCSGPGTPVTVSAAATTSGIDFALQAGARIGGTITDASTGSPLPDVRVEAVIASRGDVRAANTTATGTFQIDGLPTGSYYVRTAAGSGRYVNQLYRGVTCRRSCDLAAGQPIAVTAGALQSAIDFRLVATGSLAGHVTDSTSGAPLRGAQVEMFDESGSRASGASVDDGGGFSISGLVPGLYYLWARGPEGFGSKLYDGVPCPDLNCSPLSGTPVVVSSGTTRRVDVSLDREGSISGRITAAGTGLPLQNVWVFAHDAKAHAAGSVVTDAFGQYLVEGLAIGNYHVSTATLSSYMDEVFDDVRCPAECDPAAGRSVSVQPHAVTSGIDFVLDAGGQIAGTATDAGTDRLLADVTVDVLDQSGVARARASTTAQGTYLSPGLPAGSYFVRATPDAGFVPQVFQGRNCPSGGCTLAGGTPVAVTALETTVRVDFPLQCAVTIDPAMPLIPAGGGTVSVTVTAASPDCRWRAAADPLAPWLTVDESLHVGTGTLELAATANDGAARTATPLVAGLPLDVTQPRAGLPTYYLAEGATGDFFDLDIAIANPNDVDAPVAIRFLTPGGVAATRELTIGALRQTTIRVDEIAGLESTAVSTEVTSSSGVPLVVERTMFWDRRGYGGHGGTAVEGASTRWYFAEGFQGFFDTYVLVANPGATIARCAVTFLLEHEPAVGVEMVVGAGERASLWTGSVTALADRAFGIVVEADQPVVAERVM